jgi:hypothetical protein
MNELCEFIDPVIERGLKRSRTSGNVLIHSGLLTFKRKTELNSEDITVWNLLLLDKFRRLSVLRGEVR